MLAQDLTPYITSRQEHVTTSLAKFEPILRSSDRMKWQNYGYAEESDRSQATNRLRKKSAFGKMVINRLEAQNAFPINQ